MVHNLRAGQLWFYSDAKIALKGVSSSGVAAKAIMAAGQAAVDEAHANASAPYQNAEGSVRIEAKFRGASGTTFLRRARIV
jgi:hypothetical protein